jgi:hypothetical protein
MFSSTTHCAWACAVVLALATAPGVASVAQAAHAPSSPATRVLEDIRREQSANGATAESLITLYATLGLLYRESGDQPLAAAAFQSARQVVRANHGLYSLEELPLIRQSMLVERELGDAEAAWKTEKQMLGLAARYPSAPETVPIYMETAARRLETLAAYRNGVYKPELVLGCYYGEHYSCVAGSRRVLVAAITDEARGYYTDAMAVMLRNDYSDDQLRRFADEVLHASYPEVYIDLQPLFRRILDYEAHHAVPVQSRVDTLMMIADWNVRLMHVYDEFDGSDIVVHQYELARRLLASEHGDQAKIDALFAPKVPVSLPDFVPNPLVTEPAPGGDYIDVSFDVTSLGSGANVAIEGSRGATRTEEKELERLIKQMIFRPRLTRDGVAAAADRVAVRYYLRR